MWTTGQQAEAETFGDFTIIQRLGAGALATVDRAYKRGDAGFVREVALKRLRPLSANYHHLAHRFFQEADMAARLSHGNVAQIHEFGCVGGVYFLSMEYVEGIDLATCLREMRRTTRRMWPVVVMSLMYDLLDGLSYAHQLKVVHRDVSPGNLMLTRYGSVKILDFGTAVSGPFTPLRSFEGKLSYAAPEAIRGGVADLRSDLYSCGVVAYELLTGLRPQMTIAPGEKRPRPPSAIAPVPPELDAWVMRAMDPVPYQRFESARHMSEALLTVCQRLELYPNRKSVEAWLARPL